LKIKDQRREGGREGKGGKGSIHSKEKRKDAEKEKKRKREGGRREGEVERSAQLLANCQLFKK